MDQGMRSYWAEFLGTFTLCFIGQGAICTMSVAFLPFDLLTVAVAHGLALAVMISALGATSGGHFNPAVTFGFLVTGRQSTPSAIAYWVSQLLGALVASFLLEALVPAATVAATHLGAPGLHPSITPMSAVLIEAVLTFLLVTTVWGTAVDERAPKIGGFGIGLCVLMDILVAGPLTGAAMNPARAFGAAIASGTMDHHWVYWIGPMAGGAIAALIYRNVVLRK
jgi:MIP family channel proteins